MSGAGRPANSKNDTGQIADHLRIIDPHDHESTPNQLEIARVVARLLVVVPAPPVHLDDHPALDEQIHASDAGDHHLHVHPQPGVSKSEPNE